MESITTIVLIVTVILLIAQAILIYTEQRKYKESLVEFENMKRALSISRNKLLDSERERVWLNNQIAIIFEELKAGKAPENSKNKPSWQYDDESPMDPRD